jgi:hypothetical protein
MSFELPERLKIGHINFDVLKYYFDQSEDFWYGKMEAPKAQICINPDLHPEVKQDTLMHEALHACFFVSGWHPPQEERIVRTLSPLLCALIKDNPEAMMYFMERYGETERFDQGQNTPSPELGS